MAVLSEEFRGGKKGFRKQIIIFHRRLVTDILTILQGIWLWKGGRRVEASNQSGPISYSDLSSLSSRAIFTLCG